ncbi:hypothetical protein [Bradyrhizobium sp. CCBAU 11434]|nr:hypothetical protein [Bradyrhizobium sp. CCBAU 11434]
MPLAEDRRRRASQAEPLNQFATYTARRRCTLPAPPKRLDHLTK